MRSGSLILLAALCGCKKPAAPAGPERPDTGADAVAKTYFEALVREDWPAAYAALDPDSRAGCSAEQFAALGRQHRQHMGFNPADVAVSVSETGDQAAATAMFRSPPGPGAKQYRDGAALRRTTAGWAVVLRKNFGREPPPKPGKG